MQLLLINPYGGFCASSLSTSASTLIFPAGTQSLSLWITDLLEAVPLGCSRRHLGHKGWQKKAHGVKREEAGTEETLLCWWWQEPEKRQSQLAEERMTATRLTGNSQALLNTTTAQTWPSSEDRTEPIKHLEGQNLGQKKVRQYKDV